MTPLNVTDVTRIATEAAREQSSSLQVMGVTLGGGGGDYAEVIVDITGSPKEPCRVSIGVFRNTSASVVHDEIAGKLQRHIVEHGA